MQIQLTEEQVAKLREAASRMDISVAEFVRRAVDQALALPVDGNAVRRRALKVIGCISSGTGDLSVNHDAYLDAAYDEKRYYAETK